MEDPTSWPDVALLAISAIMFCAALWILNR